ncbi:hypothetical protein RY280_23565 [Bacillus paralicheniformis]|uniref:hypothetical protein n=1 Tax=Bacillus paralicheniformis TaxID=1648923 RepID=UPI003A8C7121
MILYHIHFEFKEEVDKRKQDYYVRTDKDISVFMDESINYESENISFIDDDDDFVYINLSEVRLFWAARESKGDAVA